MYALMSFFESEDFSSIYGTVVADRRMVFKGINSRICQQFLYVLVIIILT